jgi:glycerol kinase
MDFILSLDQGTTSSRAILFDRDGHVVATAQREFRQSFPQPGWVEHDATEIWQTQLGVMQDVLARQGVGASQVAAIGVTNQRETTVLWDRRTGEPVAPAIVWQDRRTAGVCAALRAKGKAGWIQERTGLLPDAYFSATKLAWLLDQVPGARARADRGELAFGTVDSWLVWKLTGGRVHATDASNASRTLLFNLQTLRWDPALLRLFDIPASVLPQVVPSSGVLGETEPALLGAPVPIAGLAGDQQAALFGQACFAPGMAKNTYGTGCFMLMNTGESPVASRHQLLTTVAWQGPSGGAPSDRLCAGGLGIHGRRDGPMAARRSADHSGCRRSGAPGGQRCPDTGDVYLVPAFAGLGTPDWDGHARGTLVGMTRGTTRAHIARAALEAIALQTADVFGAMAKDSGIELKELRVDGGASRSDLLMQMQADFLGVPVVRPRVTETTALGAACLAGLATGFWGGADEITARWATDRRFEPSLPDSERSRRLARWRQAVERSRGWVEH